MNSKILSLLFLTINYVYCSPSLKDEFISIGTYRNEHARVIDFYLSNPGESNYLEWNRAKESCLIGGREFAYLRSPTINKRLTAILKSIDVDLNTIWVAGIGEEDFEGIKYHWEYSDDEQLDFAYGNWKLNEPQKLRVQSCVVVDTSDEGQDGFKWAVEPCKTKKRYLCMASH